MLYEDVDWCLRAWHAGFTVVYFPLATLEHYECTTRGTVIGEREQASRKRFWARWGAFLDDRPVRTPGGALRVIYVSAPAHADDNQSDIVRHLNGLHDRGHDVTLFTVGPAPEPGVLRAPVRTFAGHTALIAALTPLAAIKVATCVGTAPTVWRASVLTGLPAYLVREPHTSESRHSAHAENTILASYRPEFRFMTGSRHISRGVSEHGVDAALIDDIGALETFLEDVATPRPTSLTSDARPKLRRTAR